MTEQENLKEAENWLIHVRKLRAEVAWRDGKKSEVTAD